jgi:hypothetical protein
MDVTVSMKLSPKQAGALYVKAMRLEDEIKALKAEREALKNAICKYPATEIPLVYDVLFPKSKGGEK